MNKQEAFFKAFHDDVLAVLDVEDIMTMAKAANWMYLGEPYTTAHLFQQLWWAATTLSRYLEEPFNTYQVGRVQVFYHTGEDCDGSFIRVGASIGSHLGDDEGIPYGPQGVPSPCAH